MDWRWVAVIGSTGMLEVAINQDNAAEQLRAAPAADFPDWPDVLRFGHRRAIALLCTVAICGFATGVAGSWLWAYLSNPYRQRLGQAPFDDSEGFQDVVSGALRFSLHRDHQPDQEVVLSNLARESAIRLSDIQTRLADDELIVAGYYQIQLTRVLVPGSRLSVISFMWPPAAQVPGLMSTP